MKNKIKIIVKNKGNLLANANVIFETYDYGTLILKDFQIWKSPIFNTRLQDNINIQPPGIMIYGKFRGKAFFEKADSWYSLESEIYHCYLDEIRANEININDIP